MSYRLMPYAADGQYLSLDRDGNEIAVATAGAVLAMVRDVRTGQRVDYDADVVTELPIVRWRVLHPNGGAPEWIEV